MNNISLLATFASSQPYGVLRLGLLFLCIGVVIAVLGVMAIALYRQHRLPELKNARGEIVWTVVAMAILLAMAWPAVRAVLPF